MKKEAADHRSETRLRQPPSRRLRLRLKIRALLGRGLSRAAIAFRLGCHPKTVSRWRRRLRDGQPIADRPRSGRPPRLPPETTPRLIALCCQHRPLPGCSGWSLRRLEAHLRDHPQWAGASPSRSTIQRRLAADDLKLHRRRYFLQIRDPDFFPKMEHIIDVYRQDHEHLYCLDQCTGLQALQRIAPSLPLQPRRAPLIEHQISSDSSDCFSRQLELPILRKGLMGRGTRRLIPK